LPWSLLLQFYLYLLFYTFRLYAIYFYLKKFL